ncbi:putative Major facilitator superfamily (MFS) profile domain-containing protein [Seiridium unicorne]|uniref:Major facilitator superfamily (MFS) profile domain-containing protein n=1 Tax=Seiridium unicorne TaxID=138068 RepID=A0ABR2VEJ5_9PEZI
MSATTPSTCQEQNGVIQSSDEQEPLLGLSNNHSQIDLVGDSGAIWPLSSLLICYFVMIFHSIGTFEVPMVLDAILDRILRTRLCSGLPPDECGSVVQKELAPLRGYQHAFSAISYIPGVLPGAFDLRWTWISAVLTLISGGEPVFIAQLYSTVERAGTSSDPNQRYFGLGLCALLGDLMACIAVTFLLDDYPFALLYSGLAFFFLSAVLTLFISPNETISPLSTSDNNTSVWQRLSHPTSRCTKATGYRSKFQSLKSLSTSMFFGDSRALLILSAAMVLPGPYLLDLVLQYANRRYGFEYSKTMGIVAVFLFSFIPVLAFNTFGGSIWPNLDFSSAVQARYLAIGSAALSCVANLILALAWEPWLFAIGLLVNGLGASYIIACRIHLGTIVPKRDHPRMHVAVNLANSVGIAFFSWLLQFIFHLVVDRAGWRLGGPFFALALSYILGAGLLLFT